MRVFFSDIIDWLKVIEMFNILENKKWCACGDSFTHGDFTGLNEEEKYLKDGKYQGEYCVYPYIIGNRNHMDIVMNAYNGATMAECDREYDQTFIRGHYKDIPLDTDYITLCFGINDWHQNVPIGIEDSKDITTFNGAWNVCMDYLLENYPYAHIGIIVTNGSTKPYTDATIEVAIRYGIPYLDMVNDCKVPLMHRVDREGVLDKVKDIRMKNFTVSESNRHPNPQAHLYESSFIENFLRSI